jgi:hypothetical protein
VSCGDAPEDAAERLVTQIHSHILSVMTEGNGFEELKLIAKNNYMDEYWCMYRYFEFALAEEGRDLSHEVDSKITKAIQDTFDNKIKEIIGQKAGKAAEDLILEYERISAYKIKRVAYAGLKVAA